MEKMYLVNGVTGFCTVFAGIVPLLYCWLARPQPARWLLVYFLVFVTGVPTVIYHGWGETQFLGLFDIGTNLLLAWGLHVAVAGDFYQGKTRRLIVGISGIINALAVSFILYQLIAGFKVYVMTFGSYGGFTFGETVLITDCFVAIGMIVINLGKVPGRAKKALGLMTAMFFCGLLLATASNQQLNSMVFAWHSIWHIVGGYGFITLWLYNDLRFNPPMAAEAVGREKMAV